MPARKPDEIKKLTGTLQNCRVNVNAPKPAYGFPVAPSHLTNDEIHAWNQACQLLHDMGVLTMADAFAVEEIAVCKAELTALRRDIATSGRTYTADTGLERTRPVVRLEMDKARHFLGLLGRFGLTPADRSKVNAKTGSVDNPFDAL